MTTPSLLAAFAAVDAAVPPSSPESGLLVATKVKALMTGYEARWGDQEWRAIAVEQVVVLPVVNPNSERTSRTWRHAGKWDGIVTGYGHTALLEHKGTSEEIADPSAPYWRRLTIDSQVSQYVLQAWQSGVRLDSTLYDVIRRPTIRPRLIPKKEREQIIVTHRYGGQEVPDESLDRLRSGADSEDFPLYGLRLAAETLAEPNRYFQRRRIPRLDAELVEYATELWQIGKEIQRAQLHGLHFRNPQSCMQFNTPCEYLSICSGVDDVDSDRWERRANVHEELEGLDGDGSDVLTNSRIKCFQTCRRKHYLRYVEGIRRRDEGDREALYFGQVLHLALEAWWKSQSTAALPQEGAKHAQRGNSCAVIEAAQHASA